MAKIEMSTRSEVEETQKPSHGTQYLAAFSASTGALAIGCTVGFTSPASAALLNRPMRNSTLDDVTTDDSDWLVSDKDVMAGDLTLTVLENSWFASSLNIGALVGCLVAGVALKAFGRKGTMLASCVPLLLGWALIGFAQNLAMLIAGRVLNGLSMGMVSLACPTYITENVSKEIRGVLGSGFMVFGTSGCLFGYIFGALLPSWRWLALVCACVACFYTLLAVFLKESPSYLLSKGREAEAREVMQYFRGPSYNIESEMKALKTSLEESSRNKLTFSDLTRPYVLKPLLIVLTLMACQQASGINPVLFNVNLIFKVSGTSISEDLSSIAVGLLLVLGTVTGSALIDRAGRKVLLAVSAGVMSLAMTSLGVFFYIKSTSEAIEKDSLAEDFFTKDSLGWLPLASLILYIFAFGIGFGPIPWFIVGELFHPSVKEVAGGLVTAFNWTSVFFVTFVFAPLQTSLHDYGVYWLYGSLCGLSFVFCVLFVPETKGKTLKETTAFFGGPEERLREERG